ncbi:hypothetical protein XENOCAPTIV_000664 [Xenoophorus captivus]|uniref:Uncharacterized protein n=1 Tax=Xenoophorus captivus TaxID=1517983 RepID=A0ABV0Q478_9TELE
MHHINMMIQPSLKAVIILHILMEYISVISNKMRNGNNAHLKSSHKCSDLLLYGPTQSYLVILESHFINKEDCWLIPAHLLCFDNSLMKKNNSPSSCSWSGLHRTLPAIAFHPYSISKYGSSIKLTNVELLKYWLK